MATCNGCYTAYDFDCDAIDELKALLSRLSRIEWATLKRDLRLSARSRDEFVREMRDDDDAFDAIQDIAPWLIERNHALAAISNLSLSDSSGNNEDSPSMLETVLELDELRNAVLGFLCAGQDACALREASSTCARAVAEQPWRDVRTAIYNTALWRRCFPKATGAKLAKSITNEEFVYLRGIIFLDMTDCEEVTDEAMVNLPELRCLNMTRCTGITCEGVAHLPALTHLNAAHSENLISSLFPLFRHLEVLNVVEAVTDEVFLDNNYSEMKQLRQLFCGPISDDSMLRVPAQLEWLGIHAEPGLTDVGMLELGVLPALRHLTLVACEADGSFLFNMPALQSVSLLGGAPLSLFLTCIRKFMNSPATVLHLCTEIKRANVEIDRWGEYEAGVGMFEQIMTRYHNNARITKAVQAFMRNTGLLLVN
jgi:hypothetical protein